MADEQKRRRWTWVVVALLALLVMYPLSFGPMLWLCAHVGLSRLFMVLYAPLFLAAELSGTGDLLVRYMGIFVPLD